MKTWIRVATLVMFTGTLTFSTPALMAASSQRASAPAPDDNMSRYRTLATDTMTAFKNHDMVTAKKKAKELEKAWDDEQKALQKASPDVWNQIDKAMDDFIKPAQDKSSDVGKVQSAYDAFIAKLQLAVK